MNINKNGDPSTKKMVEWYRPKQLFLTGRDVAVSTFFSHHSDRRSFYTQWSETDPKPISFKKNPGPDDKANNIYHIGSRTETIEQTNQAEDIWIDFVADTGDGGNSTYTVAKSLFEEKLNVTVKTEKGNSNIFLPRGDLLILGGDLAYPVANETEYRNRFLNFFEAALPITKNKRNELPVKEDEAFRAVVSFPQNHDWYDNLSIFSQIFCRKEKETFLDMKCPQNQSYAAVELPFNWWLFGFDFALSGDIDELQFVYFKKIIDQKLAPDSKIIIQYPEPVWFLEALGFSAKNFHSKRYEDLERLIEKKRGNKDIEIRLAGDQHYYRRYTSSTEKNHLITCGCGGAFLHPTHGPKEFKSIDIQRDPGNKDEASNYVFTENNNKDAKGANSGKGKLKYTQATVFPSEDESYNLSKKNFYFLKHNLWFGIVTSLSYFLVVWMSFASLYGNVKHANLGIQQLNFDNIIDAMQLWGWSLLLSPLSLLTSLTIIFTFYFFTREFNPHAKKCSRIIGIIHGAIHFVAIFLLYYFTLRILGKDPVNDPLEIRPFLGIGLTIAVAGGIIGAQIMGLYLFVSVNLFKISEKLHSIIKFKLPMLHSNEAFSSLRIEDYKGFLRFRITEEELEAFFIGIREVPREWKLNDHPEKPLPKWKPVNDGDKQTELIDYWTVKTPK